MPFPLKTLKLLMAWMSMSDPGNTGTDVFVARREAQIFKNSFLDYPGMNFTGPLCVEFPQRSVPDI